MSFLMDSIRGVRNIRAEMNVPAGRKAKAYFVVKDQDIKELIDQEKSTFSRLAGLSDIIIKSDKSGIPQDAVAVVVEGAEIFMPLEELIDLKKEIERLEKEKANLEMELDRVNKKLSNQGFVEKAPAAVIDAEKEKLRKYSEMYEKILERLETLVNR